MAGVLKKRDYFSLETLTPVPRAGDEEKEAHNGSPAAIINEVASLAPPLSVRSRHSDESLRAATIFAALAAVTSAYRLPSRAAFSDT